MADFSHLQSTMSELKVESQKANPLPDGWVWKPDPATGQLFYHHAGRGLSQWHRPPVS